MVTAARERPDLARLLGPAVALLAATVLVVAARYAIHDRGAGAGVSPPPVPADTEPARPPAPPAARPPAPTPPPQPAARTVTIRSGDTLAALAERHDVTLEELLAANPGIDPVALRVGQSVRLPAVG
jgi:LysM repeat protein